VFMILSGKWKKFKHNNAMNADSRKRRSFVAPLSAAGYGER